MWSPNCAATAEKISSIALEFNMICIDHQFANGLIANGDRQAES